MSKGFRGRFRSLLGSSAFWVLALTLAAPSEAGATRFLHNTGVIALRVDDTYPAGFVELRDFPYDSADVLWRAFIVVLFEGYVPWFGRAADSGPLASSNFPDISEIDLIEDTTVADSTDTILCATSNYGFGDEIWGFWIHQTVTSCNDSAPYILVRWVVSNEGSEAFPEGRFAFHFDADVPDADYTDDCPHAVPGRIAACQLASPSDSNCVGLILLCGGTNPTLENTLCWEAHATDTDAVARLAGGEFWRGTEYCYTDSAGDTICPTWVDSIQGDVGIGFITTLPALSPGESETVEVALAVAPNPDSFEAIAANIDTMRVAEGILPHRRRVTAYPNPFNTACTIEAWGAERLLIRDIRGRLVDVVEVRGGKALWRPRKLPTGVYLISPEGKGFGATKVFLVR